MKKKRRTKTNRKKSLTWTLIILVLLLVITLYFLSGRLNNLNLKGELGTIGIVSVDDDINTTSIIDVSINEEIIKQVNFTHLDISDSVPYTNLIFYMPFDEDDETNFAYDYARSNNGVINGVPSFVDCIYSKCYNFDGDNDFIGYGDNDLFDFEDEAFTISVWVKGEGIDEAIISKDDFDAMENGPVIFTRSDGSYAYNNGSVATSFGDSDNNWHHLALTRETVADSRVRLYFDGELVNETNDERTLSNSKPFIIATAGLGSFFEGTVDDFMIFNVSLDPLEITNIYNNESARYESSGNITLRQFNIQDNVGSDTVEIVTDNFNNLLGSSLELRIGAWDPSKGYNDDSGASINNGLIGYWHADGNANDASSEGHNGVEKGGVGYTNGIWGESFNFDGIDDHINISSIGMPNDFTISTWIRNPGNDQNNYLLEKSDGSNINYALSLDTLTRIICQVSDGSDTSSVTSSSITGDNHWHNIVCIRNNNLSIYIDGKLERTIIDTTTGPIINTDNALVGCDSQASNCFNGSLDDLMIFNRAIGLEEIESLYVKGRADYQFTNYQTVDGNNEFDISEETTNILTEYKFNSDTNRFYTPLLFTGIQFDYDSGPNTAPGPNKSFDDDGIVDIVYPINNSNTFNKKLDINYTVAFNNVSSCWYSNGTFRVNITLDNCQNITDIVWKRGDHEVRVYANASDGNISGSRVFFEVFNNYSGSVPDDTEDVDFNQSDPSTTSNPIDLGVGDTLESANETESDPTIIVYYLIIGILLLLILIVIFFLIKASKAHGII